MKFFDKTVEVKLSADDFEVVFPHVPKPRGKVMQEKINVYLKALLQEFADWAVDSKEVTNFNYEISRLDIDYLPSFLAIICGKPEAELAGYIAEAMGDEELKQHYRESLKKSPLAGRLDESFHLGRRLGWYAVVRAMKPQVVVESGVEAGVGGLCLSAALRRNIAEGHPGRYIGIDLATWAGSLITGPYAEVGEMIHGDSIESIAKLDCKVDLFVSDSDHSVEYERGEYETIADKLTPNAIVIADNAHVTNELQRFAMSTGRRFLYFQEHPVKHWSRMSAPGIGFCFRQISRD